MKILATGGGGTLVPEMVRILMQKTYDVRFHKVLMGLEIVPLDRGDLDITQPGKLISLLEEHKPDVFYHAAAMTKPMQDHEFDINSSIETNIKGTCNLVQSFVDYGACNKLVYVSTDYVASSRGNKLYNGTLELDPVKPINNYGRSKLAGELVTQMLPSENWCIHRMSFMPDVFTHPKAYSDSYKNPLSLTNAATASLLLLALDAEGIYHLASDKTGSIFSLAMERLPKGQLVIEACSKSSARYPVPESTILRKERLDELLHGTFPDTKL